MFAMEIFVHVREVDYYPNIFVAHCILFTVFVTVVMAEKKFKAGIVEELIEVNNDSREVKFFGYIMHREQIIGWE